MPHRPVYYHWLLAALLVALCVTLGYLFLAIPNLEVFTAAVFASGFLTGPGTGLLIGAFSMLLFSLFNPYGAPTPPLFIAQIFAIALTGMAGGWMRRSRWLARPSWVQALLFGALGFLLTLFYDVLTTLSFAVLMTGGNARQLVTVFLSGMAFYGIHLLGNTLVFALLLPALLQRLRRITLD
ncbi:MAG TPA: hypothetical protein PLG50_09000 [bacterium]|nr:hypothetical protein [bacterium]HQG45783.1 hypothetical protein [bacterium]HQI49676.1 hypothetical protein [bacterium]HQJ64527.1 hypothetical protein [bacterium]